ncbi:hypothetical protein O7606_03315 [Micromonospora sp. WMMD882]|uniref:hypothetical protein n=1 Tax=Micromonospora sp. WMMD882 TaxID=3015151 RepID=UPI00248CC6EB|nr:hypothetical protein [Micromonospora sp. WMMD882]WBB80425.1 hypothetical protein O7606_03315 [Micromonospora sp. WMMD882]
MPAIARIYLQGATRRVLGDGFEELDGSYRYVRGERTGRWSWEVLDARKGVWTYGGTGPNGPRDFVATVRADAENAARAESTASLDVLGSMELGTVDPARPRAVHAMVASCVPVALHATDSDRYLLCHRAPTTEWADVFRVARANGLTRVTVHCPPGAWDDAASRAAAGENVTARAGTPWESNATWVVGGPVPPPGDGLVPGADARPAEPADDAVPGAADRAREAFPGERDAVPDDPDAVVPGGPEPGDALAGPEPAEPGMRSTLEEMA